jgi:choline dehydrogenase-like flavoprotein
MPRVPGETANLSADVIVVGAGSAGAVIARRLVDAGARVILLEAGGEDTNPAIHEPSRVFELWGSPQDWNYYTAPQEHAAGRALHWPRGKVLGGSSALNGMIYVRGYRGDYDHWAYLGNHGWSYDDVLPLFKRSESFDGGADVYRGGDGPLSVTSTYPKHPVHESFVAGAQDLGIPFNPDYNGAEIEGISWMQMCLKDGKRHSTAVAFLRPIMDNPNLTVVTDARARRLLFDGDRCTGVESSRSGTIEELRATSEVVVSCGVIESPRLLMLSGIGRADDLGRLGIDARVNLPGVGKNLHDHALVPIVHSAAAPIAPPVSGTWPGQTHFFARSKPGLTAPDLQPLFFTFPAYDESWMQGPSNGFTLMAGIVRPASRGSITLRSADPDDELVIDPAYLSRDADVDAALAAMEICREIGQSNALAEWGAKELYPGSAVQSREQLVDYARRSVLTYHHQVGTCKMGIDADAVVDPELRVYGISGLRVADASIMPAVTSGNTHAPSMMIGEKAANLIVASHGTS